MQKQTTKTPKQTSAVNRAITNALPDITTEGSKFQELGFVRGAEGHTAQQDIPDVAGSFLTAVKGALVLYKETDTYKSKVRANHYRGMFDALNFMDAVNTKMDNYGGVEHGLMPVDRPAFLAEELLAKNEELTEGDEGQTYIKAFMDLAGSQTGEAANKAYAQHQNMLDELYISNVTTAVDLGQITGSEGLQQLYTLMTPEKANIAIATTQAKAVNAFTAKYDLIKYQYNQSMDHMTSNVEGQIARAGLTVPQMLSEIEEAGLTFDAKKEPNYGYSNATIIKKTAEARLIHAGQTNPTRLAHTLYKSVKEIQTKSAIPLIDLNNDASMGLASSLTKMTTLVSTSDYIDMYMAHSRENKTAFTISNLHSSLRQAATERVIQFTNASIEATLATGNVNPVTTHLTEQFAALNPKVDAAISTNLGNKVQHMYEQARTPVSGEDETETFYKGMLAINRLRELYKGYPVITKAFEPEAGSQEQMAIVLSRIGVGQSLLLEQTLQASSISTKELNSSTVKFNWVADEVRKAPGFFNLSVDDRQIAIETIWKLTVATGRLPHVLGTTMFENAIQPVTPYVDPTGVKRSIPGAVVPAGMGTQVMMYSKTHEGAATGAFKGLIEESAGLIGSKFGLTKGAAINMEAWQVDVRGSHGGNWEVLIAPLGEDINKVNYTFRNLTPGIFTRMMQESNRKQNENIDKAIETAREQKKYREEHNIETPLISPKWRIEQWLESILPAPSDKLGAYYPGQRG